MIAAGRSVICCWAWIVLVCSCWPSTRAIIKQWRPVDADWQDRNNWNGGRLPCWRSTVVLPEEAVVSVFVNGTVSWAELVMPQTGELVLDGSVTVGGAGGGDATPCDAAQVKFKNWQASSWFDPDRWAMADPFLEQPLAVPHSERIPCAHDSVHLSDKRALSLDFNRIHSITVGQVKYGDKSLTADEWRNRLAGTDWRYQVRNPPGDVHVNGTECQEPLGCSCGHNVDIMQLVCSNAGTLCGNQLECPDGFRPPGHCCDMCGAMMKLTVDERIFTKSALDRLVSSMIKEDPATQSYSYRTGGNVIHLTIVDNTTNEMSTRIATKIRDYLTKDQKSTNLYGIVALELLQSGLSHSPAHHLTPEELRLIASNLATTFVTFILIGLTGAALYYYKRHRFARHSGSREDLTVSFARFQNDSGNVEIGIDTSDRQRQALDATPATGAASEQSGGECNVQSPYAQAPEIPAASSVGGGGLGSKTPTAWKKLTRAFVNPLFGDPSASSRMSGRWTMSSLMKSAATQENPIFDMDIAQQQQQRPRARDDINSQVVAIESSTGASQVPPSDTPSAHEFAEKDDADSGGDAPEASENASSSGGAVGGGNDDVAQSDGAVCDDDDDNDGALVNDNVSEERTAAKLPKIPEEAASQSVAPAAKGKLKKLWKRATRKFGSLDAESPPDPATGIDEGDDPASAAAAAAAGPSDERKEAGSNDAQQRFALSPFQLGGQRRDDAEMLLTEETDE